MYFIGYYFIFIDSHTLRGGQRQEFCPLPQHTLGGGSGGSERWRRFGTHAGTRVFLPHLAAQLCWCQREASRQALTAADGGSVCREGTRTGRSPWAGEGGEGTGRWKGPGGPEGFVGQEPAPAGRCAAAGRRCPGLASFPFPQAFTEGPLCIGDSARHPRGAGQGGSWTGREYGRRLALSPET